MKLKDIKKWLNEIPSEFDDYFVVYREAVKIDEETNSLHETQVIGGYLDHEEKRVSLIDRNTHYLLSNDDKK